LPRLTGYPVSARNDIKGRIKCRQAHSNNTKPSTAGVIESRLTTENTKKSNIGFQPQRGDIFVAGTSRHHPLVREPAPFEKQNPLPDETTIKNQKLKMK
jgi:hypothetical protein